MATNIIITRATTQAAETVFQTPWQLYAAAGVGVVFAALLFKPFFKNWSGFWECFVFSLKPDWISWFQGEGTRDWWCELKLAAWMILSVASGIVAFVKLPKWLPGMFGA